MVDPGTNEKCSAYTSQTACEGDICYWDANACHAVPDPSNMPPFRFVWNGLKFVGNALKFLGGAAYTGVDITVELWNLVAYLYYNPGVLFLVLVAMAAFVHYIPRVFKSVDYTANAVLNIGAKGSVGAADHLLRRGGYLLLLAAVVVGVTAFPDLVLDWAKNAQQQLDAALSPAFESEGSFHGQWCDHDNTACEAMNKLARNRCEKACAALQKDSSDAAAFVARGKCTAQCGHTWRAESTDLRRRCPVRPSLLKQFYADPPTPENMRADLLLAIDASVSKEYGCSAVLGFAVNKKKEVSLVEPHVSPGFVDWSKLIPCSECDQMLKMRARLCGMCNDPKKNAETALRRRLRARVEYPACRALATESRAGVCGSALTLQSLSEAAYYGGAKKCTPNELALVNHFADEVERMEREDTGSDTKARGLLPGTRKHCLEFFGLEPVGMEGWGLDDL